MKKFLLSILGVILFAAPTSFNIQLTNSTLAGYLETGITQENIKLRGMYLYNDNENKNNFYLAGIKAEGNLIGFEDSNIKFSLISDFAHTKDNNAVALGFGIFSFVPKVDIPLFVRCEGEYAPKVLSFDESDRFSRIDFNFGYMPIENGEVFVGYRNISFNHNYNSDFYFALGYSF